MRRQYLIYPPMGSKSIRAEPRPLNTAASKLPFVEPKAQGSGRRKRPSTVTTESDD